MRPVLLILALVGCADATQLPPVETISSGSTIRSPVFGRDGALYWYSRDLDSRNLLRLSPQGDETVIDHGPEIAAIVVGDDGVAVMIGHNFDACGEIRMHRFDGTITDYQTPMYCPSRVLSNGAGSILFEGRGEEDYSIARLDLASGAIERRFSLQQGRLLGRIDERHIKPGWLTSEAWAISGFVTETGGAYLTSFDSRGLRSLSVGPRGIRSPEAFAYDDAGEVYWADGGYTRDETRIYRGDYTHVASLGQQHVTGMAWISGRLWITTTRGTVGILSVIDGDEIESYLLDYAPAEMIEHEGTIVIRIAPSVEGGVERLVRQSLP